MKNFRRVLSILLTLVLSGAAVLAARGGGAVSRGGARTSVNRSPSQSANVNRNVNVNQNVNVNRDVDVDVHGGYYHGYGGCCYHPVARTAAVVGTAAVIGSVVYANSMPSGCATQVVNGIAYQQCGSTWYQPQYAGTSVSYVVVGHP